MDRCLKNKTWTEAVKKNYLLTDESFDKYIKANYTSCNSSGQTYNKHIRVYAILCCLV